MSAEKKAMARRISSLVWPPLYAGIKIRLMILVLLALLIPIACKGLCPLAADDASGVGAVSVAFAIAAIAFLFLCGLLIEHRRAKFDRQLAAYAAEPDLPDDLREKIVIFLQRERNRRY